MLYAALDMLKGLICFSCFGGIPAAVASFFFSQAGSRIRDVLWCFTFMNVIGILGLSYKIADDNSLYYPCNPDKVAAWFYAILTGVLATVLYFCCGLPSRWVIWACVAGLLCPAFGAFRRRFVKTGLLLVIIAAAIWFVFLHLSLFDPAPAANTPAPQAAIEQQAAKSS